MLSFVVIAGATLFAMACGYFIAWLQYADRAGTYYISETTNEQCGWIHDGTLFTPCFPPEKKTPKAGKTGEIF